MTTINNVNSATPPDTGASSTSMSSMDSDAFMQMLLTQLQYQDPTNPMDSSEMVSQMSDLTTIESMSEMSDSIDKLGNQLYSSQSLYASTLVGQDVSVLANVIDIEAGETVSGKVLLPTSADDLRIDVLDANGNVVATQPLGKQTESGEIDFDLTDLDEDLAAGKYTLKAVATVDGKEMEAAITQDTTVTGVVIPGQGQEVLVEVDNIGLVPLSYITRLQGNSGGEVTSSQDSGTYDVEGQLNNFFNRKLLDKYPGLKDSGLVDAGTNQQSQQPQQSENALPPSPAALALAAAKKALA